MNGVYVSARRAFPKVCPKSDDETNAAPLTAPGVLASAPPVLPSQATSTCPFGPIAIDGPWLPQIPPEILTGVLNVAP
jgi:hypothetical protein